VPTVVVVLLFVLVLVALVLSAVYLMRPEVFKISANFLKGVSFNMEIRRPESRSQNSQPNGRHGR
jgi:hypothetical protein